MPMAINELRKPIRLAVCLVVLTTGYACLAARPPALRGVRSTPEDKTAPLRSRLVRLRVVRRPPAGSAVYNPSFGIGYSPPAEVGGDDREDEDLSKRLMRRAAGQDDTGIMGQVTRLMGQSGRRLERDFDPGQTTRTIQQQIVEKLDEAIAAAQRHRSKGGGRVRQSSDKRRAPAKPDAGRRTDRAAGDEADPGKTAGTEATRADKGRSPATGRFREFRRSWGHLPARDRDEVLQGIDEDVLEEYRSLIERYFRTLAEDREE